MDESAPEKPAALKPLEELTDADIMQLTREDCRRYLKERGMRRPSWNKAEAIQQVLLLKGLVGSCKRPDKAQSEDPVVSKPGHQEQQTREFLDKRPMGPRNHGGQQQPGPSPSAQLCSLSASGGSHPRPEAPGSSAVRPPTAQLTIFYSGIVNVFDDVPLDKAQAVMLLAGSKGPKAVELMQHVHATVGQGRQVSSPTAPDSGNAHQEDSTESCLPQARTASLQRFLAKRKERISANFFRRTDRPKRRRSSDPGKSKLVTRTCRQDNSSSTKSSGSSDDSCSAPAFHCQQQQWDLERPSSSSRFMYHGGDAGGAASAPALLPELTTVTAM